MELKHTSEPTRHVYETCDPAYLRELREAVGMDLVVLARTACLSASQVRQLERNESDTLFYSDAIKRQAYKRVLMILGVTPPPADDVEEARANETVTAAHLNTLDQIVTMSHLPAMNRSATDMARSGVAMLVAYKQGLGALMLLLVAVVLMVLHGPFKQVESEDLVSVREPVATPVPLPVVAPAPVLAPVPTPVPTPVIATAPVASSNDSVVGAIPVPTAIIKSDACTYSTDAMPQLTPLIANKEGRYVYLVSSANTEVCVVDGNQQATTLQLKAGQDRSVYGVSPWQVSGPNIQKIQIYFQGARLSLPEGAIRSVKLVEVPVKNVQ